MNKAREAFYWSEAEDKSVRCGLCPHRCHIAENTSGICGVRENHSGVLIASSYGLVSSVALDPIEKKPLYMFCPGKNILSIGSVGCSFRCRFCQNYEISMEHENMHKAARQISPDDVVSLALQAVPDGNVGVAYTYNEPLIGYEFLQDCARLAHRAGLCNVLVTNGYINKEPLEAILPLIDAMNIDLKGFTDSFYKELGGDLEAVKETIALSARSCHVEVTTLIIPAEDNTADLRRPFAQGNEGDIAELSMWLSSIDPDIPLHLTRFFPRYMMSDRTPTPRETIIKLRDTARKHLENVFTGNM